MRKLFALVFTCVAAVSYTQVWQSIGTTIGTSVSNQDLFIDQSNGDLYVAYVETGTQRANVRKWNGSSWALIGNANFGQGTSMVDIKLAVHNGQPYVAVKFLVGVQYYIRTYYLNGATWTTMGSMNYQTPLNSDYSLKVSTSGNVFLCFFNQTAMVGSTDLITLMLSTSAEGQIGGLVTDSYGSFHDFVLDPNEDPYVIHEYGDMSNYVNLTYVNSPYYDVQDVILNDFSGKIVTNLVGSTDLRTAIIDDDAVPSLVYTRYDLGTGLFPMPYTIYNVAIDDYDMASSSTLDYFFYNIGGTHFVESVNAAGVQSPLGNGFMTGSGTITDPKIETWNGRLVVSCVRGGVVRVMEIDNPCTLTLGNSFGGCEQILNTAPTYSVQVDDNNYSHANLIITVASTDALTIPNGNISLVGTFPNYFVQFTSNDVTTTTNVELEFETQESGVWTNYVLYYVDVVPFPNIVLSLPSDEVCSNHAPVNLVPYGSPAGGFWSGPGVNSTTGKFNPSVAGPGIHTINYSYSNGYGCTNDDNTTITVHDVPQISVTTNDATCGNDDGTADATITGGTPAYTIYWSNGSSTEDIIDLAAGLYFINVTDQNGCQATKPATIGSDGLTLSASITDALCPSSNNGAIDLTATSGSGIESIQWSTGATTEDVSGLVAGTYDVTVTANDGCVSTGSYTISAPEVLSITEINTPASCASSDGSISVTVAGGTSPYDYAWFETVSGTPVGSNSPSISSLGGGAYFAIITDDNGCSTVYNTMVSEAGGPTVIIDLVTPAGCTDDGAIDISVNTDVPISTIDWSNGETNEDISNLPAGFYTVEVVDQSGCMGMGGVEVPAASPALNPICLVTVDTLTNTNLLVWEKEISTDIDYYNIYRETSVAGEFLFLASVPYSDESVYNDITASPQIRSWRYKLAAVNMCGEESDLSEFHKTIHLTISFGLSNTVNLNWDNYEGFAFGTFEIWRHTNSTGWDNIQDLPSSLFSFTDSPPNINGLDYIISITPPATCTSTTGKVQDHNSSRSNKSSSITGDLVSTNEEDKTGLTNVYPNPSNGNFNLIVVPQLSDSYSAFVTDASGRTILQFSSSDVMTEIDLSNFSDGIYNLQILVDDQVINRKLVKQ
ncbi:MAG: T9SS type A sorting domain-containing protein [Crocinitomicaceae bacterium]|nr:T9SS type A sorting domain-containing protein [Crocinitomicaceae bacterium]